MMNCFTSYDAADIQDLISEYPLAWITAANGQSSDVVQMPLLGEYDDDGGLQSLFGHIARNHALTSTLQTASRVMILFSGPNGYISPAQAGVRDWAPTWNFAQIAIEAELTLLPDETGRSVIALVEAMERDRSDPWRISELGGRYAGLERGIIGFRARVTGLAGRFKLGQDERPEVREAIIRSLGDVPLARWMRRFATAAARG